MKFSSSFIAANDRKNEFDRHLAAPYLRKSFTLDFQPKSAEVTVTGLGFYELYVNGREITRCPLAPYISNPDDLVYYDNYDLAPYLKKGENVIGLLLGNGLRNAIGGFIWEMDKANCRGPVCAALAFEAKGKGEGEELSFEADESFKTHPSPVLFDDERLGYIYDSRKEIPGWCEPGFDDSKWKNAKKCLPMRGEKRLCEADPITVRARISPVKIEHFDEAYFCYQSAAKDSAPIPETLRKDVYVYDFGLLSSGVTELRIKGKRGQKIVIRHGEYLHNDKDFSIRTTIFLRPGATDLYLAYGQMDEFILNGEEQVLRPKFKYDGFRYAFVEGLTPEQATADALTFVEFNSGLAERGGFDSSSEDLNRLYAMTRRADTSNFVWFPTDCPHREKNGWTGDASMSAEHMMLHLAAGTSFREWMRSIRHAQRIDGALPGIVPTGGWGFDWGNGPTWDSVSVNVPYAVYQFDGDRAIVEENVSLIVRYLSYALTRRDGQGLVAIGLGDWVDPFQRDNGKITAPLAVTDTLRLFDMANKSAHLFREIGRTAEAAFCEAVKEEFRTAVREHLIDFDSMTVAGDCQTSQALALDVGIFTPEEEERAARRLVEIIHRDGDINTCGMIGLRHIYRALDRFGENELAYRLITSRERSCYGAWLETDATALIENFPHADDSDAISHDHHFLGDIAAWMMLCVAGLRPNPDVNDPSRFVVKPSFLSELTHASAWFENKCGKVTVAWRREGGKILLTVEASGQMRGTILVGEKPCEVLPGEKKTVTI